MMNTLKGKTVVLGITGSIAAYKIANVASALVKEGADVHTVMTKNATNFINPITFETLTNNKCLVDTFDRNFQFHVTHVSLSQKADVIMIAPASANIIGKLANGIADDMLSTMALAAGCKIIVAPAMNTHMYQNRIVQDNLKKLADYGFEIIKPAVGRLACAAVGEGKLPDEAVLLEYIRQEIQFEKDMQGVNVLVTAGPTMERLDPVRYITNHSSGKMGYAVAEIAAKRGANVTLVSGKTHIAPPMFAEVINIESAAEMYDAVISRFDKCDILVKAAAVADYTAENISSEKIKKNDGGLCLELTRTKDILKAAGSMKKDNQVICGFSMETSNLIENSQKKLASKNCDMIVANNLKDDGAGFGVDTNKITIISNDFIKEFDILSKKQVAEEVLNQALSIYKDKRKNG